MVGGNVTGMDLSVRDHSVLQLAFALSERGRVRRLNHLELTGYLESAFWARAHWLLEQPDAQEAYPQEVARLQRLRARRRAVRRGSAA